MLSREQVETADMEGAAIYQTAEDLQATCLALYDEVEQLRAEVAELRKDADVLNRIQTEQPAWTKHNFGDRPAWMPLVGAVEELGELSHAFLKRAQNIRMEEDHDADIKDALADTIIYLCDFASSQGIALSQEVSKTWDTVRLRDWVAIRRAKECKP